MPKIQPFRTRQVIRADHLNQLVDRLVGLDPAVAPARRYLRPVAKGAAAQVRMATVYELAGEYLICTITRGENAGRYFYVAKPPNLRTSFTSHDDLTFTYTDSNTREADSGAETESQELVPPYTVGDEIAVIGPVSTGVIAADSSEATWLDLNVWGRMWGVTPA